MNGKKPGPIGPYRKTVPVSRQAQKALEDVILWKMEQSRKKRAAEKSGGGKAPGSKQGA